MIWLKVNIFRDRRTKHKSPLKSVSLIELETNHEPYFKRNKPQLKYVSHAHNNIVDCDDSSLGNPHSDDIIANIYWKKQYMLIDPCLEHIIIPRLSL